MAFNPAPLTPGQMWALLAVSVRELTWVLPSVEREVRGWRKRALEIPDRELREDALTTLTRERLNTEGAALFSILPARRDRGLLKLLVAYELVLDYLDTISERPADDPLANGRQLHLALIEALEPGGPVSDYYRYHPHQDDGGYLGTLVLACREGCAALPGIERVRPLALRAARQATVQTLNHDPEHERRDATLAAWAAREFPDHETASWFELTAAACSSLWILTLLALAADPATRAEDIAAAASVYMPWICAASTLLDSFVDQADDAQSGNHNYLAHYPSAEVAAQRLREIVFRSVDGARRLRRGTRHTLIASGVVCLYLTKDSASDPALRPATREMLRAAGSLPRVQVPIMRIMRVARRLASA